jgi:ribosomal protein L37AE/L43A
VQKQDHHRRRGGNQQVAPPKSGTVCPNCDSESVKRTPRGKLRCEFCRHEWR